MTAQAHERLILPEGEVSMAPLPDITDNRLTLKEPRYQRPVLYIPGKLSRLLRH